MHVRHRCLWHACVTWVPQEDNETGGCVWQILGMENLTAGQIRLLEIGQDSGNLFLQGPSGSGKFTIATILMIRQLLATAKADTTLVSLAGNKARYYLFLKDLQKVA